MADNKGIDSPAVDLAFDAGQKPSNPGTRTGGEVSYPMQTPSNALAGTVHRTVDQGDAPSDPRSGSKGNVDRSTTSDALIKTQ